MTHLRKMMLEELQRRHYSEATTQRYIRLIERFTQHSHCSPDRLEGPIGFIKLSHPNAKLEIALCERDQSWK